MTSNFQTSKLPKMSHTNTELRNIIKNHFSSQGKRMSNLTQAKTGILMGIINKHNIELTEPKKKECKKIENTLDTTNHPFKLGTFDYTYEWDDDNGAYGGRFTTVRYTITKITKYFVTVEYNDRPNSVYGKIINKKYKIDHNNYNGWFFSIGEVYCKTEVPFNKSININESQTEPNQEVNDLAIENENLKKELELLKVELKTTQTAPNQEYVNNLKEIIAISNKQINQLIEELNKNKKQPRNKSINI